MFGAFGYELDLSILSSEEKQQIRNQNEFYKKYRSLFQFGTFYRLQSPFEKNDAAWMMVSKDQKLAAVGFYRMHEVPNGPWVRLRMAGLMSHEKYKIQHLGDMVWYGSELMNAGIVIYPKDMSLDGKDFSSALLLVEMVR